MLKKIIKYTLVTLLPKRMYENRKPYIQFVLRNFENFVILLISFYYKILNPKYLFLPYRHTVGLFYLLKVEKILNDLNIEHFITAGALMGAVRQGAFAGRPNDLDIGIKECSKEKLELLLKILKDQNFKITQLKGNDSWHARKWFLIDIAIFRNDNDKYWVHKNSIDVTWKIPYSCLNNLEKINFYDLQFNCPSQKLFLIEEIFGKEWKIPDKKKQYYFKKTI
jgi:hypothetical protein